MSTLFGILVLVFIWAVCNKEEDKDAQRFTQDQVDEQRRKVRRLADKKLGWHPDAYIHKVYSEELDLLVHMQARVVER